MNRARNGRAVRHRKLEPRNIVHENPYYQISRMVVGFRHSRREYFVAHCGTRVGIVVVRGDEILLSRQYRLPLKQLSWEIPGGKVDDGESLEAAAIRECAEETGIRCAGLKPLIHFHAGETVDNPTYVFYSRQVEALKVRRDVREAEPPQWVPLRRCLEMVFTHQIVDTLSIIALSAYQLLRYRRHAASMVRLFAEADLNGHGGGLR